MSLRRMTETEGHDGCHRKMSPRAKIKTKVRCVSVCLCVSVYLSICLPACLPACLSVCLSVFYCDVVYIMSFDLIQSVCVVTICLHFVDVAFIRLVHVLLELIASSIWLNCPVNDD